MEIQDIKNKFWGSGLNGWSLPARLLAAAGLIAVPLGAVAWQASGGSSSNLVQTPTTQEKTTPDSPNTVSSKTEISQPGSPHSSSSSSQHVSVNQTSSTNGKNQVKVEVNGRPVEVPPNGELHKTTISPDGGKTQVDISRNSTASGSDSSSYLNLEVKTTSNSDEVGNE